jgi:hypothetical protein
MDRGGLRTGGGTVKRSAPWVVAMGVACLVAVFVWRSGEPVRAPEPVRFATVAVPAFEDGGTLTDAWADFDGDGDPDRFVGFNGTPSRLYRNDGTGGFTDVAGDVGLNVERAVRTAAWGDFDGDGDPDLFLGYAGSAPVTALYRNDGGRFTEVAAEVGLELAQGTTRQASWVDYDADGDLDLFLALRDGENQLFAAENGVFTDVTETTGLGDGRRSVGAVWFDAERDGDLDVYVANMNGDANGMWVRQGDVFVDLAEQLGLADGGRALDDEAEGTVRPCAVDYDNDGDLDLFTANYGPNGLLQNPGGGGPWTNVAAEVGLAETSRYDTCAWGDFDHDGSLDLYVNGTVTGGRQYRDWLYRREGGPFLNVTPDALDVAADHGATWVDYDLDGDLDLALTGVSDDGMHHLVQNLLRPEYARHHLKVRVLDDGGAATLAGATVRVYAAGTKRLLGTGLVDSGSGYDSQNDLPVHIGLRTGEPVDVEVASPGAGGEVLTRVEDVDPEALRGSALEVRAGVGL